MRDTDPHGLVTANTVLVLQRDSSSSGGLLAVWPAGAIHFATLSYNFTSYTLPYIYIYSHPFTSYIPMYYIHLFICLIK